VRHFSFRPALTLRGRTFKGLRGWAGKPLHPPLTDVPVAAYLFAAVFDVISVVGGAGHPWAREFWHAGTYVFVGGVVTSLGAAATGFWDWLKSTEPGNQARRTVNAHAWIMLFVTAVALSDTLWRALEYSSRSSTPVGILVLSLVAAACVAVGATYGGSVVFDYGFNVETAGDSPVWHRSETDVLPGGH